MNNTRIFEGYYFLSVKNFGNLIGVKVTDSGGKSVSRCDPTESERIVNNSFVTSSRRSIGFSRERGGTRTTRGKRRPVTEIKSISVFRILVFASGFMNYKIDSLKEIIFIKNSDSTGLNVWNAGINY